MTQQVKPPPTDPYVAASGTHVDPRKIRDDLNWLRQNAHLVSPAPSVSRLPEGCAVSITMVWLKPDDHDTYPIKGSQNRGLSKASLNAIANAAGVKWDPFLCCRLDDGSDPLYVRYQAVGRWSSLDGTDLEFKATKELDLRQGSPLAKSLSEKQLLEQRIHIQSHAETKAKLRAIRDGLAIRTSYEPDAFQLPWCVVKLAFTGHSEDPQIRLANAMAIQQKMLGGVATMYRGPMHGAVPVLPGGPAPAEAPMMQAHHPQVPPKLPPPPVGNTRVEYDSSPDFDVEMPAVKPQERKGFDPAAVAKSMPPADEKPFNFGKCKGKLPSDPSVTVADLEWYIGACERTLEDPEKVNFHAKEQANLATYRAVLATKLGGKTAPKSEPEGGY